MPDPAQSIRADQRKSASHSIRNAFTVDLEEWFQGLTSTNPQVDRWPSLESRIVPATQRLLGILRQHDVRATFFVLGHVADHHPDLIADIHNQGHEIGVHGYYHRFVHRLTPAEFAADLARSIEAVTAITGERPLGHRAPYFSVNGSTPWVYEQLRAHGIRYDSSIFPTRNMLYGQPGAPRHPHTIDGLVEFPVATVRAAGVNWPIAGGFYVRALPYAIVRWGIRRLNRQSLPAVLYAHPWELDTGQQYDDVTLRERITHYHGRAGLEEKWHRLFSDFQFTTLRNLFEEIGDWRLEIGDEPTKSPISNLQ